MTISPVTASTYIAIWMHLPVQLPVLFSLFNSSQLGS